MMIELPVVDAHPLTAAFVRYTHRRDSKGKSERGVVGYLEPKEEGLTRPVKCSLSRAYPAGPAAAGAALS